MSLKECLSDTSRRIRDNSTRVSWWFQTLLQSPPPQLLYSGEGSRWHDLKLTTPPLRMCVIEKIASTQWRKVFHQLDQQARHANTPPSRLGEALLPRFVFLRDPLERFLSAFLDQCINRNRGQCEPTTFFDSRHNMLADQRVFFDAFVSAMPLKWNLHFSPFGLYCDGLYRHLPGYDFVGNMGPHFYKDLQVLGQRFGPSMQKVLDDVFHVTERVNDTNYGVETSSPRRVQEFYTARTVRQVLEYHSIDYVTLELEIPLWAREMLQREELLKAEKVG